MNEQEEAAAFRRMQAELEKSWNQGPSKEEIARDRRRETTFLWGVFFTTIIVLGSLTFTMIHIAHWIKTTVTG